MKRKCTKKKCTKRNAPKEMHQKKCTKRKCTKRKYSNRKSTKYGGKLTANIKNDELKNALRELLLYYKPHPKFKDVVRLDYMQESEVEGYLDFFENNKYEYEYNLQKVYDKFYTRMAHITNPKKRLGIIIEVNNELMKEAENATPKATLLPGQPLPAVPPPKTDSNVGCPSSGIEPSACTTRDDYLRQLLIFHPDKNMKCDKDANEKFLKLRDTCKEFV
jgi:hypothetical protein